MNKTNADSMFVDGRAVQIDGERNVLEIIRKAGVDLPTFCYHSDLSIYGACRLCLVAVDGRGIQGACSLPPERGLRVRTNTEELRNVRRVTVELLLANHDQKCPTCPKSGDCQLQALARKLGIRNVRFKPVLKPSEIIFRPRLVRDPNRCVLCGDCSGCVPRRRGSAPSTSRIAGPMSSWHPDRAHACRRRMRQLWAVRGRVPDGRAHGQE